MELGRSTLVGRAALETPSLHHALEAVTDPADDQTSNKAKVDVISKHFKLHSHVDIMHNM